MTVYLDCNASTPLDQRVGRAMADWQGRFPGNASAVTHRHGGDAASVVQAAREHIADTLAASPDEILFTSGATESNNLAILGLAAFGERSGKRHLLSTAIEHPSVLAPLRHLQQRGFELELVPPDESGRLNPDQMLARVRKDTLLLSVMAVNNVTGVVQPLEALAQGLRNHDTLFHVDGAQGFGRLMGPLRHPRIQLLSLSAHKIYGPMGIGALLVRGNPPLEPLFFGGDQQGGLRPGTLPVPLIGGFGLASRLAGEEHAHRQTRNQQFGHSLWRALQPFNPVALGDQDGCMPHVLCVAIPGVDAEMAVHELKPLISVSRGAACSSLATGPSHVLSAMALAAELQDAALRFSWYHETPEPDWTRFRQILASL